MYHPHEDRGGCAPDGYAVGIEGICGDTLHDTGGDECVDRIHKRCCDRCCVVKLRRLDLAEVVLGNVLHVTIHEGRHLRTAYGLVGLEAVVGVA